MEDVDRRGQLVLTGAGLERRREIFCGRHLVQQKNEGTMVRIERGHRQSRLRRAADNANATELE